MIFHISFEYTPDNRDKVHERFKETGAPPPDGVTMTGRWHSAAGNRGFLVAEAEGAEPIARWLQEWTELVSFEVVPVLTDAEFRNVVA
ncbi:MAG: DUF3303 family protein [Xanthomonadales bacterium]|nr:DUF3303 family protein [Xanthomonadales bacterium]